MSGSVANRNSDSGLTNPQAALFAHILVDGDWITNPEPNEGFHLIGALTEDGGPERVMRTADKLLVWLEEQRS